MRSHALHTLENNMRANVQVKLGIVKDVVQLVGVVQNLMKAQGYSLSKVVHAIVKVHGSGALSGIVKKKTGIRADTWMNRLVALALAGVGSRPPDAVFVYAIKLVFVFVVRPFKIDLHYKDMETIVLRHRDILVKLGKGADVDLRPLVRSLLMAMDPVDVRNLARWVLRIVFRRYLDSPKYPKNA